MNLPCDCCAGVRPVTPVTIANRPGLACLTYRAGTYGTFLGSMLARLSSAGHPELAALRTRELGDPALALLDGWAIVGDVLTFYQERVANEGYLRTATERRSVLELARLIGYAPRPGVAATVYLAYTIEKDSPPVEIPVGTRASSVPGPAPEQLETFETADPLEARVEWNELRPRLTKPQTETTIKEKGLFVEGTSTNLKPNDVMLVDVAVDVNQGRGLELRRVESVTVDVENKRTAIKLRPLPSLKVPGGVKTVSIDRVRAAAAKFASVEKFEVAPESATAKRVLRIIKGLANAADRPEALEAHLEREALPKLEDELKVARESHFTKLTPWIEGLVAELRASRVESASPEGENTEGEPTARAGDSEAPPPAISATLKSIVERLVQPPSLPPPNAQQLERGVSSAFGRQADSFPRLLASIKPQLQKVFYTTLRNIPPVKERGGVEAYALRVSAAPFGHNAPLRLIKVVENKPTFGEWDIDDPWNDGKGVILNVTAASATPEKPPEPQHDATTVCLDNEYDLEPNTFVVIERHDGKSSTIQRALTVSRQSLNAYGLSGKTLRIGLKEPWLFPKADGAIEDFAAIRGARVFTGSQELTLVDAPVSAVVEGDEIELAALYEDLEPGRWLIIAGERRDILDGNVPVAGVQAAELVMLTSVEQKTSFDTDPLHTFITLAEPLAYQYERSTLRIYGNVVRATHGETRKEVLGSGHAEKRLQQFVLKQPPLTYVSAATTSGVESTLEVRVNEVKWHEADGLATLESNDRSFITRTDDDSKTAVIFGDGEHGARLPTGVENVKAVHRRGIGKGGNVRARQITLTTDRPFGVKEVLNPLRASGGADKETRDSARRNAPVPLFALDRLVSVSDYADFARTFAGVGKAAAARLSDGRTELLHVTIAGADDIPIEPTSDLRRNLDLALRRFGDANLPLRVQVRTHLSLVLSANVKVSPDYAWEFVEPKIRAALLDRFGFDNVELAGDLLLTDAIATIQGVAGVDYVDVDVFDVISEQQLLGGFETDANLNLQRRDSILLSGAIRTESGIVPAELAYLTKEVPETLILQELKP